MTVYKGTQSGKAPLGTSSFGNAWSATNKITPATLIAQGDEVILLEIPAGVKLTKLRYRSGDMDTNTTLEYDVGYRSKHADPDLTTDIDYFLDGVTTMQSAVSTWTDILFEEITFNEPVEIYLTGTAASTGISGTPSIYVQADGIVVGVS